VDIRELAELAEMPVRNVRYLISEGFVDQPAAREGVKLGRDYGDRHLLQLRTYKKLRDAGLSQQAIRLMTEGREPSDVEQGLQETVRTVVPGIEMRIVPALVPEGLERDELVQRILEALAALGISREGTTHADGQDEDRGSAGEAQGRRARQRRR
jgi:DNA-binding transcriptional MerR regulator